MTREEAGGQSRVNHAEFFEMIHWVRRSHGEVQMWTDEGSDGKCLDYFLT